MKNTRDREAAIREAGRGYDVQASIIEGAALLALIAVWVWWWCAL